MNCALVRHVDTSIPGRIPHNKQAERPKRVSCRSKSRILRRRQHWPLQQDPKVDFNYSSVGHGDILRSRPTIAPNNEHSTTKIARAGSTGFERRTVLCSRWSGLHGEASVIQSRRPQQESIEQHCRTDSKAAHANCWTSHSHLRCSLRTVHLRLQDFPVLVSYTRAIICRSQHPLPGSLEYCRLARGRLRQGRSCKCKRDTELDHSGRCV